MELRYVYGIRYGIFICVVHCYFINCLHCDVCRANGFVTEVSCQQLKCERRTMKHSKPKELGLKVGVLLLFLLFEFTIMDSLNQPYPVIRFTAQNVCISDQ